jgi:tRNA threonylcarbamoyladenosine biosynthesis protein TsaB
MEDGVLRARRFEIMERGQAEALNPMIAAVMNDARWGFEDIDLIGVTIGPGAFTGLRIGLACARALALVLAVPVVGITTFDTLARAVPESEREGRTLVVAVNGKRRDVFYQLFDEALNPLAPPASLETTGAAQCLPTGALLVAGDGAPMLRPDLAAASPRVRFSSAIAPPDAAVVAVLATEAGPGAGDAVAAPLYIRSPDARLPGAGSES